MQWNSANNVMKGTGLNIFCRYKTSVVIVNSEELTGNTEYLTLMTRSRLNGYRYNRVRLTGMRRITTFRSTTDRTYDGGPIRLQYYNTIL